jgi:hypothetical protein
MRKTNYYLLFLLLFMVLPEGCELTEDGSYTAPITLYEKIQGNWTMNNLKLIDEIAKVNSIKPDEMIITSKFEFGTFKILFSVDESMQPTTYEVQGNAPQLFATSGFWELDKPFTHSDGTATKILLYSDAAKTLLTDELTVTAIPGKAKILEFKLTRKDNGTPFLSYVFKLKPAN